MFSKAVAKIVLQPRPHHELSKRAGILASSKRFFFDSQQHGTAAECITVFLSIPAALLGFTKLFRLMRTTKAQDRPEATSTSSTPLQDEFIVLHRELAATRVELAKKPGRFKRWVYYMGFLTAGYICADFKHFSTDNDDDNDDDNDRDAAALLKKMIVLKKMIEQKLTKEVILGSALVQVSANVKQVQANQAAPGCGGWVPAMEDYCGSTGVKVSDHPVRGVVLVRFRDGQTWHYNALTIKTLIRKGDNVRVSGDIDFVKQLAENGGGGWNDRMGQYLGKKGVVQACIVSSASHKGLVVLDFGDERFSFSFEALELIG